MRNMNFLCALNDTIKFFRSCREAWILVVISAFVTFIQSSLLPYPTKLFIAEMITESNPTARILTSLLTIPFLLTHAYLLCILTALVLDFGRSKATSLKRSAKTALKRYLYFIASAIIFSSIIFLCFYSLECVLSTIFPSQLSFSLNLTSKILILAVIMALSVYLSIRLSLFYCFAIDGAKLNSLKLSWIATREVWKDIFLLVLIFLVIGNLIPFLSGLSSVFIFTSITFLYLYQIEKEGCYET
jgi:hypothetical protein